MAAKLTRLTHIIAIQLHLVAEGYITCSSRSRRPVRKLLETPSYMNYLPCCKSYKILAVAMFNNSLETNDMLLLTEATSYH